jgi:hypothetical protein
MRFGVRSKAVEKLEDVKTNLISVRRIIFTPSVEVKDELKNTSIQITCLDEDGTVLKRVTSGDTGEVEDNEENENSQNGESGGSQNGQNSEQGQQGEQGQSAGYALTISKSGTGTASVTHDGNAVASGASLNEDDEVEISITPAEGKVPTASVNGSSIELTETEGVYEGSFAMPGQASSLMINTGTAEGGDSGDGIDKD